MTLFLDTSSLVKLYMNEVGTQTVKRLVSSASTIFVSLTTYAEARSALARARASGRLNETEYRRALSTFESDWQSFSIREISRALVLLAGDLAEKYLLRGFDSVHLASAVTLQNELAAVITFSSADGRLTAAAGAEGLTIP